MKLLYSVVMKVAYSSVNLMSVMQLKYLLTVAFLATVALCSDEFERSSRQLTYARYSDFMALKREVDALRATRATAVTNDANFMALKREVDAQRIARATLVTNDANFIALKREVDAQRAARATVVTNDANFIALKREVDTMRAARANVGTNDANFIALKREVDALRFSRATVVTNDANFIALKREVDNLRTARTTVGTNGGAVFIRWGRTVCPFGSVAVYKGVAGGSWYSHTGGGSNYLCLPHDPIWGAFNTGMEKNSKIHGSEYQSPTGFRLGNNNHLPLHDNNVPCVVCRSETKTSVVMIPARNQCYGGWNTEYTGFLMAGNVWHPGRTEFVCMDGEPETLPHGYSNEEGALFYNVEGVCGSLPCPPYVTRREITCAVCSK